ncbi:MAG: hypothetical protein KKH98_07520, partial [Spirochaetes bacterium]|nr:hypothetical protein [Spirochaetota bacterium]
QNSTTVIKILRGTLRIKSISFAKEENIIIQTKNSEIIPSGTDLVIDYNGSLDTSVYVFDGKAQVLNPNQASSPVQVNAYQMSSVSGKNIPAAPSDIPDNILKTYDVPPKPELIQPIIKAPETTEEVKTIPETPPVVEEPKMGPEPLPEQPKPEVKPEAKPKPKKKPEKKPEKKPVEKKEPWCKDPKLEFHLNFDLMYAEFNKQGHVLLALMPEFVYCKIGLAFYLPIYYNYKYNFMKPKKSWYNFTDWDFSSPKDSAHDLWIKFLYIRYGKKGDPFFIRIGGLSGVTFANGFIMNDYSNMLNFPKIRKLGLQFDYIFSKFIGFETLFDDVSDLKLYGGRFVVFPFGLAPDLGMLTRIQIGSTLIYDKIGKNDRVINWGLDLGFPLVESNIFNLRYGIDYATFSVKAPDTLNKDGWVSSGNYGFSTGFKGNIAIIVYRAEYRYLKDGYIPEYFDNFYDLNREIKYAGLITMYNTSGLPTWNGYLANAGFQIAGAGEVGGTYQEYYDENNNTFNKAKLYLTIKKGVIPKFYGTAAYHKINVVGLTGIRGLFGTLYDENTTLTFDGGFSLIPFTYITLSYQKSFEYDEDGNLQSYETYSTGLSLGF